MFNGLYEGEEEKKKKREKKHTKEKKTTAKLKAGARRCFQCRAYT